MTRSIHGKERNSEQESNCFGRLSRLVDGEERKNEQESVAWFLSRYVGRSRVPDFLDTYSPIWVSIQQLYSAVLTCRGEKKGIPPQHFQSKYLPVSDSYGQNIPVHSAFAVASNKPELYLGNRYLQYLLKLRGVRPPQASGSRRPTSKRTHNCVSKASLKSGEFPFLVLLPFSSQSNQAPSDHL